MNEEELGRRIVARLDQSLTELPNPVAQKLRDARMAALAAYGPDEAPWAPLKPRPSPRWGFGFGLSTRLVLPAAFVVASITGLIYWQMSNHHDEELDTGLLAGELPLHAYTDPGFETWLKHSNHEPSQQ